MERQDDTLAYTDTRKGFKSRREMDAAADKAAAKAFGNAPEDDGITRAWQGGGGYNYELGDDGHLMVSKEGRDPVRVKADTKMFQAIMAEKGRLKSEGKLGDFQAAPKGPPADAPDMLTHTADRQTPGTRGGEGLTAALQQSLEDAPEGPPALRERSSAKPSMDLTPPKIESAGLGPEAMGAEGVEAAKMHYTDGLAAAKAGNFSGAIDAFEQSFKAAPHENTLYNLAKAHLDAGNVEEGNRLMAAFAKVKGQAQVAEPGAPSPTGNPMDVVAPGTPPNPLAATLGSL